MKLKFLNKHHKNFLNVGVNKKNPLNLTYILNPRENSFCFSNKSTSDAEIPQKKSFVPPTMKIDSHKNK